MPTASRRSFWRLAATVLASSLLLVGALSLKPCRAEAEPVALTFDDLPVMSINDDADYQRTTMARLIKGLHRHHYPAFGFAIGGDVESGPDHLGERLLNEWMEACFPVGNHTWSHNSLNKTPVETYIADTARADALLRGLMRPHGQTPQWFRHPYLDTGATLEDKHRFEGWLKAHGYRVAPVTMENSDWEFSPAYDQALKTGDLAKAEAVRRAYVRYTASVVTWYRAAGLQLLGRRPAYVFLLHACRLNADSIDDLAHIFRENGLKPVSLAKAMRDPVYRRSDDWADADGDEWLTRWAHLAHKKLDWDKFPDPPSDISDESDRLDPNE